MRCESLGHPQVAENIGSKGKLNVFGSLLSLARCDTGIVDEDMQRAFPVVGRCLNRLTS